MINEPLCPYCYEGVIVEDNTMKGVYFCNHCFKEVRIKKFNETTKIKAH